MCQEHSEEVAKLQFELAENKKQHEIATKELKLSLEGAYKTNLVSDTKTSRRNQDSSRRTFHSQRKK